MSFKKYLAKILFLWGGILPLAVVQAAEPVNWSEYRLILEEHVEVGEINSVTLNVVDYPAVKRDVRFERLIEQLAQVDLSVLKDRKEKLAFYINVYNVYAIKMVVDHWPMASIKDAGSFFSPVWKKEVGILAGRKVTLHEIEHEILRKLDEPRIHFAIVCASVSCPDLMDEPYEANQLDEQLDRQVNAFLANDRKGMIVNNGEVLVSKIFDWFEEDFDIQGGVEAFIRKYRPGVPVNADIDANIDYDWQLNGPVR